MITELGELLFVLILLVIVIMSVITFGCIAILSTAIKTMVCNNTVVRLWNKLIK